MNLSSGSSSSSQLSGPPHRADLENQFSFAEAEKNLDEIAAPSPISDRSEGPTRRHEYLEDVTSRHSAQQSLPHGDGRRSYHDKPAEAPAEQKERHKRRHHSEYLTKIFAYSYLVLFAILGTLTRLVIESLTFYPGSPVTTSVLWANVGGSFVMGFLSEDKELFRNDSIQISRRDSSSDPETHALWKAQQIAHKKAVPLYIGLTTGFCGCLTSFSTFMRDVFLALSNNLLVPHEPYSKLSLFVLDTGPKAPNGGFSFMAVLAVLVTEIGLSMVGLTVGAHVAIFTSSRLPRIQLTHVRRFLDPLMLVLASLAWIFVICLVILLPHVKNDASLWSSEIWAGPSLFALAFAPVGCLTRFYISLKLNRRIPSFPLGTFTANIGGTMILGMAFSLQHASIGSSGLGGQSLIGCQALQGIIDGFCGSMTTVSTWVLELSDSKRKHAYIYGSISVAVGMAMLIIEIGSLWWTRGFELPACFV